jgi:predicted transcriptional regulator
MSILKVSIRQVKAARALLDWSQTELANAAGVSVPTVKRLEAEDGYLGGRSETARRIREAVPEFECASTVAPNRQLIYLPAALAASMLPVSANGLMEELHDKRVQFHTQRL